MSCWITCRVKEGASYLRHILRRLKTSDTKRGTDWETWETKAIKGARGKLAGTWISSIQMDLAVPRILMELGTDYSRLGTVFSRRQVITARIFYYSVLGNRICRFDSSRFHIKLQARVYFHRFVGFRATVACYEF